MAKKTVKDIPKGSAKLSLKDIANGSLVGKIHDKTVEFYLDGKVESVDVRIKQLPVSITDPLYVRLNKGESVFPEWAAQALVDEYDNNYLTKEQIEQNFVQSLATALFPVILGVDELQKDAEGK